MLFADNVESLRFFKAVVGRSLNVHHSNNKAVTEMERVNNNKLGAKWKSRLLSSGLPLEHEIARKLSKFRFSVSFDYGYSRLLDGKSKEFSTDIRAFTAVPIEEDNNLNGNIALLTECKYRNETKKWIFLPDINSPEYSDFITGGTIKCFPELSLVQSRDDLISSFESDINFAIKGVEVNTANGEVFDKDIRHGLAQLKFALPYQVKQNIMSNILGHIEDARPEYIISILVTNSDLYLLHEDFSIEGVKNADEIEQLADKVPYLIYHSDIGPDFTEHHRRIFKDFAYDLMEEKNMEAFEEFQKSHPYFVSKPNISLYRSPKNLCWDLENSSYSTLKRIYSQHFICSFEYYSTLVEKVVDVISQATEKK